MRAESAGTFLDIDLDNLDREIQRQAKLVKTWSDHLAEAKLDMNEAKSRFDLVKAELTLAINEKPELYGLEHKTIPMVEACIVTQHEFQKAQRRYNKKRYAVDTLQGTVEGLDNKKTAMEMEVKLFLAAWFASPNVKGSSSNQQESIKQRSRRMMR